MKKRYIKPQAQAIRMDYTFILCNSDPTQQLHLRGGSEDEQIEDEEDVW